VTVAQLIAKLQAVRQDATVLTDLPQPLRIYLFDKLASPTVVMQGVAMKTCSENGTSIYVSADDWENYPQGQPGTSVPAIYIGTGVGIVSPEWQSV
jgi:hypothetical protein